MDSSDQPDSDETKPPPLSDDAKAMGPSDAEKSIDTGEDPPDAPTEHIVLYAAGNIENAFCNQFPYILNTILVVAFQIQPLLVGVVLALKTMVDAITDPIMAHITDNTVTRFGRRRPFILVGAVGRLLTIVLLFLLFPATNLLLTNEQLGQADRDEATRREAIAQDERDAIEVESLEQASDSMPDAVDVVATEEPLESIPLEAESLGLPEGLQEAAPSTTSATSTEAEQAEPASDQTEEEGIVYRTVLKPLIEGARAFVDPDNAEQRKIVLYVGLGMLIFTLFSTVVGTPYFAFGIELCSSYEGRTKLTVYRSIIDKVLGILNPWIPPFIFWAAFYSVIQGYLVVAIVFAILGIGSTVLMIIKVPEPERKILTASKRPRIGFFKSLWVTVSSIHFLRVFALYQVVGVAQGSFVQFAIFLNIYYVIGSASGGSGLTAIAQTLGVALALVALPLNKYIADRFEKHRAILMGVCLMAIGSVLTWWTFTPENPWLQLVNPFFFSVGISGFYSIMAAMLADVTDVDELVTGQRREGMFAAVMSLMGKMVASLIPLLSAAMLTVSGFDPQLKFDQDPDTFVKMRMLYAFAPLLLLVPGIIIAATYPLTRARMAEIKAELVKRRRALIEESS